MPTSTSRPPIFFDTSLLGGEQVARVGVAAGFGLGVGSGSSPQLPARPAVPPGVSWADAAAKELSGSPSTHPGGRRTVLVVDDEVRVGDALRRILVTAGFDVSLAVDGSHALEAIETSAFDVILTDIRMPGLSGTALLQRVRALDLDVPVILMTGEPSVETAVEAVALGAVQYLTKPLDSTDLVLSVARACKLHALSRTKRAALAVLGARAEDQAGLGESFDRMLETMWMAYQPIVDSLARDVYGYEALLRSREPALPHPGAVIDAAERLDRLFDLGRRVRALSAQGFATAPPTARLFVNLHTRDLLDDDLYAADAPLARIADRVVLELTERAALEQVEGIPARLARLRALGYRIAIDDLGAGYAGLSSFVALQPELVKLDMSLVRGVDAAPIQQRLIGSLAILCKDLGIRVVAEGIETRDELDTVKRLGADLLQGFYFARPGAPFPPLVGEL